ncbi:MAG TPA: IPT/TIG domain-containing protein, partial [Myxococcota bacterium]|nr:IPT/TIG domain-containing protein [Myxococcota bacterium]
DVVVNRPALDDVAAQTSTVTAGYTYLPSPADVLVLEVTPSEGPLSAETEVFIVGQSFSEGAKVLFGTKPATNVRVLSSEVIQALAPPGDVRGVVPVRVELVNGASHSLDNAFTYLPDEPVAKLEVLGIIPSEGPLAGGNTVTIEGRGFVEGATVAIGGNSATDVRVLGQAAITATAPAGNGPGLVDVRVEIPESGDNLATTVSVLERAYFYQPEPSSTLAVLAVIPPEGPLAGGTQVAIRGTGFVDGARVFFDGEPCLAVSYLGPDGLVCRTPTATVAGQVDVRVENPAVGQDAGPSAFLTDGYRYLEGPPGLLVLRAIPDTGPTAGGNIVTLEGTGFVAGAQVFFGGAPATGVTVLAETALTATAPSGATAGPVDIRVQLPIPAGGTSG